MLVGIFQHSLLKIHSFGLRYQELKESVVILYVLVKLQILALDLWLCSLHHTLRLLHQKLHLQR